MSDRLTTTMSSLESIQRKAPNGEDYWTGRDLQVVLGYTLWQNFDKVIRKGEVACRESGVNPAYHFIEVNKEIEAGKGARGERGEWYLTRYACYLTAMNGDSAKQEIAAAQTYFAVQTRRQELADEVIDDPDAERIELRERVLTNHKTLMGVAKDAGVARFAIFNDAGNRGLYGMSIRDLKKRKGIPEKETIFDYAGRAELAAHDFRITQTEGKIKRERITGESNAIDAHRTVGAEVRSAIKRVGGVMPENMPTEQHIRKLVSARKKSAKTLPDAEAKKLT